MLAYVVRRLLWLPVLLLAISFVTFALGRFGPGDPVQVLQGQHLNPEIQERVRHELGLDKPFLEQYQQYVTSALQGDFGVSYKYRGEAVSDLILRRLAVSAQLSMAAIIVSLTLGILIGIASALRAGTAFDLFVAAASSAAYAIPSFVSAPMLMWLFAGQLKVLPVSGWDGILSARAILPVTVISLSSIAYIARQTRASVLEVLDQDYVRTARAKGLLEKRVIFQHVLPNSLIPIATIGGLMLGSLVGGFFITESVFGIPGIGRLGVEALFSRDYPVIMAMTLLIATAYVLANLVVDLTYAFLDPRIRYK